MHTPPHHIEHRTHTYKYTLSYESNNKQVHWTTSTHTSHTSLPRNAYQHLPTHVRMYACVKHLWSPPDLAKAHRLL